MSAERRYDVITFGETMLRLSTDPGTRLEDAQQLRVTIGGAESNVAVALARLGKRCCWLSALPSNPIGRRIVRELTSHGVDTNHVIWSDARAGVYFLDPGSPPRSGSVLYDRAESAVATISPDDLNVELVASAGHLHLTGITPALSLDARKACLRLANAAIEAKVPISFDVNYRSKLWSPGDAVNALGPFLHRATLLFCNASDARTLWSLEGDAEAIARGLLERTEAGLVVVPDGTRESVALPRDGEIVREVPVPVTPVDAVGAGDAFAAGFLHRWLDDPTDLQTALHTGLLVAGLKLTIYGDHAVITADDLDALENSSVRIQR